MVTKTIHPHTSYRFLILESKNPAELAIEVNRLFNFGVVPTIPEDYQEGKDKRVTLQTYEHNMAEGFLAMALSALQLSPRHVRDTYKKRKGGFIENARRIAEGYRAEFSVQRQVYATRVNQWANAHSLAGTSLAMQD